MLKYYSTHRVLEQRLGVLEQHVEGLARGPAGGDHLAGGTAGRLGPKEVVHAGQQLQNGFSLAGVQVFVRVEKNQHRAQSGLGRGGCEAQSQQVELKWIFQGFIISTEMGEKLI
jgi:hypothetical protein